MEAVRFGPWLQDVFEAWDREENHSVLLMFASFPVAVHKYEGEKGEDIKYSGAAAQMLWRMMQFTSWMKASGVLGGSNSFWALQMSDRLSL